MRVACISNVTMDPLDRNVAGHDVVAIGSGSWPAPLVPGGYAPESDVDAVIVHVDLEAIVPPAQSAPAEEVLGLVRAWIAANPGIPVVLSTALCRPATVLSHADPVAPDGVVATSARWNLGVAEIARANPLVAVADLARALDGHGLAVLFADNYWYAGRIRYSQAGLAAIGAVYADVLDALARTPRKLIVLDLDNTLWGGVLGEEGPRGVALGEDGVGRCYRDFQRALRRLRETGILLAVLSKNDPGALDEVVRENPMQVLLPEDFVDVDLGWEPKPVRLERLVERVGLGLDATVVIDDSPFERGSIEAALPEVAVPDFPDRPEALPGWLAREVVPAHFARVAIGEEDLLRSGSYRARAARRDAEERLEDFIDGLGIRLTFRRDDATQIARLSQLTQKTNQFNLTTRRVSAREMGGMLADESTAVVAVDYEDRYGHEGTIGLAVVDLGGGEIDNLLLSCRVLGRGVEQALLEEVERIAAEAGHRRLRASFVRSARNATAAEFLARSGYEGGWSDDRWAGEKELTRE